MEHDILNDARNYLVYTLRGKINKNESRHPWRRGWEFAVIHSLRVEEYVVRILALEQHTLTETQVILLRLAAILHDIARLEQREVHAQIGAVIARKWLENQPYQQFSEQDIKYFETMIAGHSTKQIPGPDFLQSVLKDADILDEIGILSIFMSSNWLEKQSPLFFNDLRVRLIEVELPFCEKQRKLLNTIGAKRILEGKQHFIETFIDQLDDETHLDDRIEKILRSTTF